MLVGIGDGVSSLKPRIIDKFIGFDDADARDPQGNHGCVGRDAYGGTCVLGKIGTLEGGFGVPPRGIVGENPNDTRVFHESRASYGDCVSSI